MMPLLVGAVTLWAAGAHGKECLSVKFPDRTVVDGSPLTLNGLGLRQATMLKVNVYVAALYVTKPSADSDAILSAPPPKQLILHFVRGVGRSDQRRCGRPARRPPRLQGPRLQTADRSGA